jgi:tetratricopeptide (TPR) repeat protein
MAETLMIALLTVSASATTFVAVEKTDPISGQTVTVHDVTSYGSYIYDEPSKYDLVFWPFTDELWIWFCPGSGYASFGDDFDKLTDDEKAHLSLWLKENYKPSEAPTTHKEKLAWLERVYAQRQKDRDFWCHFHRLMAYVYADEPQISLARVRKALPLLEEQLQADPNGIVRIQVLFALGEYHRRLGDDREARRYFRQVKAAKYTDENGTERTGHPYFLKLIADRSPSSRGRLGTLSAIAVCALAVLVLLSRSRGRVRRPFDETPSDDNVPPPKN